MSLTFERREITANLWTPEVCGVDFTERIHLAISELSLQGAEVWTAWVTIPDDDLGEGLEMQLHQDNCLVELSSVDDDSDSVAVQDPRDQQFFRFQRGTQDPRVFEYALATVAPWCTMITTAIPRQASYAALMRHMTSDVDDLDPDMFG